jgi:hypothetical protein
MVCCEWNVLSTIGYTERVLLGRLAGDWSVGARTVASWTAACHVFVRRGRPNPRRLSRCGRFASLWLSCGLLSQGCGNSEALGVSAMSVVSAGVTNDPSNKSLRFDLLSYGLDRFCVEMLRRGAPLKLSDHEPVLGRFFADGCSAQVIDNSDRQSVVVRFSGKGYAWTNLTGRLGFGSAGLVEYAADFQLHDDSMYIYFRPRSVGQTTFQVLLIESDLARAGLGVSGVDASAVGKDIIERQLGRGFTVIRHSERGDVEYGTGLIPVGQRPFKPYQVVRSDKLTVDNERTEVHPGQQDYVCGVAASEDDARLTLSLALDGAPGADIFALPESHARVMREAYVTRTGAAPLMHAPLLDTELRANQPLTLALDIPPGNYCLVLDHSANAGRSPPAAGQQAAKIDYLLQLGER